MIEAVASYTIYSNYAEVSMGNLEEKVDKARKIIYLASQFSEIYYDAPLVVPYRYGDKCKALLKLMSETLGTKYSMKITHAEYIKHRMTALCDGLSDFAVLGKDADVNLYSYDHAIEVFLESEQIKDPNWDCLFITAMKDRANTAVYPMNDFTEEEIEEYLYGV